MLVRICFYISALVLSLLKAEAQTSALAIADSLYAVGEYDKAIAEIQQIQPKSEKVYLKLAKFSRADGRIRRGASEL